MLPLARAQRGPCDETAARGPLPGVTGMTSRDIPEHRKHGPGAGGGRGASTLRKIREFTNLITDGLFLFFVW